MIRFFCHPVVFEIFTRYAGRGFMPQEMPYVPAGAALVPNANMPLHPRRWVFPKRGMWTYEPSDEPWCRYFGIGHEEEDRTKYLLMRIGERVFDFRLRPWMNTGATV